VECGFDDRLDQRDPQLPFFEFEDAVNRAARRRRYRVFQQSSHHGPRGLSSVPFTDRLLKRAVAQRSHPLQLLLSDHKLVNLCLRLVFIPPPKDARCSSG
jgi:hypothetical protein